MPIKTPSHRPENRLSENPTFCPATRPSENPKACILEPDVGRKVRPITFSITEDGCWLVLSHTAQNGHGKPVIYRKNKSHLLSRYFYELKNGPIPAGMILVKTCETERCCAPEHHAVKDRGFFNTLDYMIDHNQQHYFNMCQANRKKKARKRTRVDYPEVLSRLARRFPDIEQKIKESPVERFFSSSGRSVDSTSVPRTIEEDIPNKVTRRLS